MLNPWAAIGVSESGTVGRRVDAEHPWPFYWGVDAQGRYLLVVECKVALPIPNDLKDFGGVSVSVYAMPDGSHHSLVVSLRDRRDWEMFVALCKDLIEATRAETTERTAMTAMLTRLKRWQRLLQRAREPLSEQEIMGLIAELTFLKDHLAPWYGWGPAVAAWRGPLASPQDFCVETNAVEVKAKLGTDRDTVEVSSLEQLVSNLDRLFLFIVTLVNSRAGIATSVHLGQMVESVRDKLQKEAPESRDVFDKKLEEVRYVEGHDYSDRSYLIQDTSYFSVTEGFPRLKRQDVPVAIVGAKYTLDLGKCGAYRVAAPWSA